jgi:hypothetical protein
MQMASYVLVLTQARVFFPSALPARWVPDLTLQPSHDMVPDATSDLPGVRALASLASPVDGSDDDPRREGGERFWVPNKD